MHISLFALFPIFDDVALIYEVKCMTVLINTHGVH